ncbi:MAG: arginine--tRNA ligase [Candidatus Andersenbacteria bacterium RIFCSPHIGHO2_01_FULL_46_36]|uniref:Arginine--tRNA ligase n=1 Tax=Candidatus Andersenbacteria bacterium RIFCSPHIGHO2_12_FULL_45_11 TaxID=1797281 RepID=A0A1G1X0U8_9BACT|nr:MAG: arginine--tRNA ligase [Candidatus Andersenbacteria bacterium RIFCSPHIGHO2_01_FULL_46_36]OGY33636.1 MAG: arginine--tRNA ligase [Candidatus Andersenbacteria bacterium RIFCSPHIGHO2_12_FULL_45_11]
MVNLRSAIQKDIEAGILAAREASKLTIGDDAPIVVVKRTENMEHGHYASSIALRLAPLAQGKVSPLEIADIIATHMPKREYLEKIEVAAPGFLNITVSREYLASRLDDLPREDLCSACNVGEGKSINMEFISANPTGPLTLGNARPAFSADTLANVLTCAGYNVTREYYINDGGEQIGRLGESVLRRILQQEGHSIDFPEDLYQGEYIMEMGKIIAERYREEDGKICTVADLDNEQLRSALSREAMQMCLGAIKKTISEDLKISFDVWSSEQAVKDSGEIEKVLTRLREKNLMYVKDGAEFLKTTEFGDDQDRVMVKKNGAYAYIAPDVAYHQNKFDREFDLIFTFMGADHQGHAPKLTSALKALGNDTEKLRMMIVQFLAVTRGGTTVSLSKRKGNIYSLKDLIEEIGYDAARYFLVSHALSSHMTLDLDIAKEKSERNPVYYVQYAYVRLQSIIRKAKVQGILPPGDLPAELTSQVVIDNEAETALALELFRFPEVMEDIATSFAVHQLPVYAYDISRAITTFYHEAPIMSETDPVLQKSRLQIAIAAHNVLGRVLDLLGISKPDIM